MGISIIIRVLNERENLEKLLDILAEQDFGGGREIIVVDNGSTDGTPELAKDRGARVVHISREDFSYPRALNMGAGAAKNEIIVILSAHSFPLRKDFLSSGVRHFKDKMVAGVYSPVLARPGAPLFEKFSHWKWWFYAWIQGIKVMKRGGMGVLGFTNAAIRKSLWEKHKSNEEYGLGGEDGEWCGWALSQGYKIIRDSKFVVRHSHKLTKKEFIEQLKYWSSLGKPQKFDREKLWFRKDLKF
jgi:glycosyltransferase involved in cell wall biosynthesis